MSVFSDGLRKVIDGYLTRYETRRSAILPVLHAIQDEKGYISEIDIDELDSKYELSRVEVREVLTFYSMYRTEPPAKLQVLFCDNIVCRIMGSADAIHCIEKKQKALEESGQKDVLTVQGVPCLGVCGSAPAMLVNKDRHLNVTSQNVEGILDRYLSGKDS